MTWRVSAQSLFRQCSCKGQILWNVLTLLFF